MLLLKSKDVKGFITTKNDNIYSNDKNQNSTKDTIATLGQELAGAMQKREGIDITTDRVQHNKYQDTIAKDLVNDISFTLNNNDYQPMAQANNHAQPKSIEAYLQLQKNNAEFKGLDKELGDNFGLQGAAIGGGLTLASQIIPELAKQYYQEDKNLFEIDYGKVYDKIDFIDIGTMAGIGFITPNELGAGSSVKNIVNSASKYKKYTKLAKKTVKNINKKERFANKASENKNSITNDIAIQSGIYILKEQIKDNANDENIKKVINNE